MSEAHPNKERRRRDERVCAHPQQEAWILGATCGGDRQMLGSAALIPTYAGSSRRSSMDEFPRMGNFAAAHRTNVLSRNGHDRRRLACQSHEFDFVSLV